MSRIVLASLLLAVGCGSADPVAEGNAELLSAPYKLFDESRYPSWVMQDDSYVYYVAEATVMRAAKLGGAPQAIATLAEYPAAVALGGAHVYALYWNGDVARVAKSGGTAQQVATALGDGRGLAADAGAAYVVVTSGGGQRILRVANGAVVELAQSTYVTGLAVDDNYLYWADEAQPNPAIGCGRNAGSVHRVGKLGGVNVTLAAGLTCPGHIELDASRAYVNSWSLSDGQVRVYSVAKTGGLPRLQLNGDGGYFTVDASYLYWISKNRELMRTPKLWYWPQLLATSADFGPFVDTSRAYFWRQATGYQLYALSK